MRMSDWSSDVCSSDLAAFDRDFLITTAMIYWLTDSFGTSARFYAEAARHLWQPSHDLEPLVQAPSGISHFTHDGTTGRSEERRVGNACVSTCRYRWLPYP